MCLKYCYNFKKKDLTNKTSTEKVFKLIFCNSCNNYTYTEHLFENYLGVNGFCDSCWDKINNFNLNS